MTNPGDKFPRRSLPGESEEWGRHAEGRIKGLEKALDILKINQGGLGSGISGTQVAVAQHAASIEVAIAQPLPPSNLSVVSNVGRWLANGLGVSTITVSWDAVTMSTTGNAIPIDQYEVWAKTGTDAARVVASTSDNSAIFQIDPTEAASLTVRARATGGVWSSESAPATVTGAAPASIAPKAPTGIAANSNVGAFQTDNSALATVTLSWTPVTQTTDGQPVAIDGYEVLYGLEAQRVRVASATIVIPSTKVAQVTVRAVSNIGVWSDPSTALNVTGAAPPALTAAPSTPVVAGTMGGVTYRWDGLSSTGAAMPKGTARLAVDVASAAAGPWITTGVPLAGAGGGSFTVAAGSTAYVRFRAIDALGRAMGTSATASSTAQGVPISGLDPDVQDAINSATEAANAAVTGTTPEYALSSSQTTAPTTGWSTTPPTRTPGSYIWRREVVTYGNGSTQTTTPFLATGNDGAPGAPGADGAPGRGVSSSSVTYQVGASGTTAPTGTWTVAVPAVPQGQFLWARTVTSYTDATSTTAYAVSRAGADGGAGAPGAPGADGRTSYLHVAYATNSTGTAGFSTTDPTGKTYLGTYTDFTEADSTNPALYSWSLIKGGDGANGSDGKGISSTTVTYQVSASGTSAPTGSWLTSVPAVPQRQFLWTRTVLVFTDGASTTTYSVARAGADGATGSKGDPGNPGAPATNIVTGSDAVAIPVSSAGAVLAAQSIVIPFSGWVGTTRAAATVAVAGLPTGITTASNVAATASADGTLTLSVAAGSTLGGASTGDITLTFSCNSLSFVRRFSWAKSFTGATGSTGSTGPKGDPGSTGAQGVSVSTVAIYYATTAVGAAAPAQPTASTPPAPWSTTEPAYVPNTELYAVTRIGYSNGTFAYTPVSKVSAYTAARLAMTTADGKNRIFPSKTQPTATATGDQWWVLDTAGTSLIGVRIWNGSTWVPYLFVADQMIAAQSITSPLIKVGTIQVDRLEPNIGEKIDITSNEGVRIVAGNAANALSKATEATALASGAGSAATFAAEQARRAQEAAASAADEGKKTRSVFDFDDAGLHISQPGGVYSLHLNNEGITINQGVTPVSLWNAGQMIVDKFVGSELVLANHKIESRGARTVFRSM